MDKKELLKVATDTIRGKIEGYSADQTNEALRSALIELNGGSNRITVNSLACSVFR